MSTCEYTVPVAGTRDVSMAYAFGTNSAAADMPTSVVTVSQPAADAAVSPHAGAHRRSDGSSPPGPPHGVSATSPTALHGVQAVQTGEVAGR